MEAMFFWVTAVMMRSPTLKYTEAFREMSDKAVTQRAVN